MASIEKKLAAGIPARHRKKAKKSKVSSAKQTSRTILTREEYMNNIVKAKEYIAAGDIFQVVLSNRQEFTLTAEPFDVYRALRAVNPSPYMYFLRMGERTVLGSSPEMLLKVEGIKLNYRPIE